MNPSKWEAWLKFLKYFDLRGWENDRILESVRPVVVRVVGTAACCVPGPGRNSCGWTSQPPRPHRQAAGTPLPLNPSLQPFPLLQSHPYAEPKLLKQGGTKQMPQ